MTENLLKATVETPHGTIKVSAEYMDDLLDKIHDEWLTLNPHSKHNGKITPKRRELTQGILGGSLLAPIRPPDSTSE